MNELNSRSRFKENKKVSPKCSTVELNSWIKVAFLIIIGWILFKFKLVMFVTMYNLIYLFIEFLFTMGLIEHNALYNEYNQTYYFNDNELLNLFINYGVVFSIIGFIDKFFPGIYYIVFQYIEKLRNIIPTFPFSGLVRSILLIIELLFKVTWVFSGSVIRFVTSVFSFIFVLLYKIAVPIFNSLFKSLDIVNEKLDSASNRLDSSSRKMEK
ncbi:hypothetical protein [Metabacillus sp. cB07]|uniref:hypothetical protein n=1 Tax=Metabacillus sp. cB07 TaxID=2806989 RepID=UPI0019394763|nr:hypothetical protein [Metabacillus sp. cB07]